MLDLAEAQARTPPMVGRSDHAVLNFFGYFFVRKKVTNNRAFHFADFKTICNSIIVLHFYATSKKQVIISLQFYQFKSHT